MCIGLNYRFHIEAMGRELPSMPTLFAKYPESIIGPRDDIVLPPKCAVRTSTRTPSTIRRPTNRSRQDRWAAISSKAAMVGNSIVASCGSGQLDSFAATMSAALLT